MKELTQESKSKILLDGRGASLGSGDDLENCAANDEENKERKEPGANRTSFLVLLLADESSLGDILVIRR